MENHKHCHEHRVSLDRLHRIGELAESVTPETRLEQSYMLELDPCTVRSLIFELLIHRELESVYRWWLKYTPSKTGELFTPEAVRRLRQFKLTMTVLDRLPMEASHG